VTVSFSFEVNNTSLRAYFLDAYFLDDVKINIQIKLQFLVRLQRDKYFSK
jgi:hypothetical protein